MRAGHDINYLSLTGVLNAIGAAGEPPPPPLNLVGDFGGGSMFLLVGLLSALWERERSGRGQVVDATMVDGIGVLSQIIWAMRATGTWSEDRADNLLDGGAPFYRTYACADGRYVAVGALEPQFYAALLAGLGLSDEPLPPPSRRESWPQLRTRFAAVFRSRSRDEWAEHFAGSDACVTPVLTFAAAPGHPHLVSRDTFVDVAGIVQPSPAPRFSRSAAAVSAPPPRLDADRAAVRRLGRGGAGASRSGQLTPSGSDPESAVCTRPRRRIAARRASTAAGSKPRSSQARLAAVSVRTAWASRSRSMRRYVASTVRTPAWSLPTIDAPSRRTCGSSSSRATTAVTRPARSASEALR